MITCRCGRENRPTAKVCSQCGSPLMAAGVGHGAGNGVSMGGAAVGYGPGNMLPTVPGTNAGGSYGGGRQPAPPTVNEDAATGPMPVYRPPAGARTVMHEEASRPIAGWLVVLRGQMPAYHDVPIYEGRNQIGRNPSLGAQTLHDANASDAHAIIQADASGVVLHDTSRNGTSVNNQRVQSVQLKKGDHVGMGKTTFVFVPFPANSPS